MRCVVVIEDTESGIRFNATCAHNGALDHSTQSIAFLLVAQLEHRVQKMAYTHILQVEDEDDITH